jgi:hypothetical protein
MNNDRHGESCARDVGARVDTNHQSREQSRKQSRNDARSNACVDARVAQQPTRRSSTREPEALTSDWNTYRSALLRRFFRDAGALASRYRVGGEDLVAHVQRLNQPLLDRGALIKPVICIGDLTVATACCLGRANAMNDLWIYAEPSMTRAAMARLPETLALTWTRRYWTQLERASRSEEGRGVARYDGSRPIRLWIVEQLLGTLEVERAAGRLTIRREQLGRPAALRLVGEQLA